MYAHDGEKAVGSNVRMGGAEGRCRKFSCGTWVIDRARIIPSCICMQGYLESVVTTLLYLYQFWSRKIYTTSIVMQIIGSTLKRRTSKNYNAKCGWKNNLKSAVEPGAWVSRKDDCSDEPVAQPSRTPIRQPFVD
jgi:hypothetical protein